VKHLLVRGAHEWRKLAGKNSTVERFVKRQYTTFSRTIGRRLDRKYSGENFTLFWSRSPHRKRLGIYMIGSCDLPAVFTAVPAMHAALDGTCCVIREGTVADSRSDILLQTLQEWPQEWLAPAIEKFGLSADYFRPRIFGESFMVPGLSGPEVFRKDVIILSIAADVTRTVYQHRTHGYRVDPGGWWLNQSMSMVLKDLSKTIWIKQNFENVGKLSLEDFVANFRRLVTQLRSRSNAHILVFNVPTIEPGSLIHNYQLLQHSHEIRRRTFNLALTDLSRELDFAVVDVDRTLKKAGLADTQIDFAHYPLELYLPIAQETFRILKDLEVF
jgi:hypothetical protein